MVHYLPRFWFIDAVVVVVADVLRLTSPLSCLNVSRTRHDKCPSISYSIIKASPERAASLSASRAASNRAYHVGCVHVVHFYDRHDPSSTFGDVASHL
eukprot:m.224630 g.224630  ORF g.224630 m.224630 type:complete len:98 (+) comp33438_c3_seq1:148-441(+)